MQLLFRAWGIWKTLKAEVDAAAKGRGLPTYSQSKKNFRFVVKPSLPPKAQVKYVDGDQVVDLGVFPG